MGRPKGKPLTIEQIKNRICERMDVDPSTGCWQWMGEVTKNGYGRIYWGYKHRPAHRVAYEAYRGPIPEGMTIDHLCRNRACVNPAHLEPCTIRVNTLRGFGRAGNNA